MKTRKKHSEGRTAKPTEFSVGRALLAVAAGAGILVTGALTYGALFGESVPYCGAGSSCDLVQASRYSQVLGVPLALWGLATYLLLFATALGPMRPTGRWRLALLLSAGGCGISLYLAAVSVLVIEAVCVYCTASLVVMAVAFAVCLWSAGGTVATRGVQAGSAALVAALALHAYYLSVDAAPGVEDPYLAELATHLENSGARFYGASWCPHCQQQKAMFGAAAKRLPYVECSPQGRGAPTAPACLEAEVVNYPTWLYGARRWERVMTPKQLAYFSGFRAPPEAPVPE